MPRKKRSAAEAAGTPYVDLPDEWAEWLLQAERLFVAFITVGALFAQREALTSLGAMRAAVERMAGAVFDATTLRLIATLRAELVVLTEEMASTSDGPSVSLHFDLGKSKAAKAEVGTATGSGPERPRPRNVFSRGKSPIRDVPKLVAAHTADFRAAARRFAVSHATGPPPPLCAATAPSAPPPIPAPAAVAAAAAASWAGAAAAADRPEPGGGIPTEYEPGECGPVGTPWPEGGSVDASSFCDWLRARPEYKSELVLRSVVPARAAQCVPLSQSCLSPALRRALAARGIEGLYTHQEAALREVLCSGRHVVVATSTASGKSVAYGAPVVQAVLDDPHARALLLFPTKALANDQMRSLTALADVAGCGHFLGATFDGDTAETDRPELRRRAHAFATNPDMLHATVLPRHAEWSGVLRGLRLVVLDEAHSYHGVWGSHVALVLRRLRRVCALYGSNPVFVCCSATIANPREHVAALTGLRPDSIACVSRDGGPAARRTIALWRPALLPASAALEWHEGLAPGAARRRVSSLAEAARLLAALVSHGVRTIAFVLTRGVAENLLAATRELLPDEMKSKVDVYRAGYSAARRRAVEARLCSGELLATVSTSALELGIDVGHVDATVHLGLPATIASLWQQAGRAGRVAGREALTLIVAQDNPLEQHFASRPHELLARKVEAAAANPLNTALLRLHLLAAAAEAPLRLPPPNPIGGATAEQMGEQLREQLGKPMGRGWAAAGKVIKGDEAMEARLGEAVPARAGAVHAGEREEVQPGGGDAVTAREMEARTAAMQAAAVPVKLESLIAAESSPATSHLVQAPPPPHPAPPSQAASPLAAEPEPELCAWADWSVPAQLALVAGELRMVGERLEATERGKAVAKAISLRAISRDRVRVVALDTDGGAGRLGGYGAVELESMEMSAAKLRLYTGAVYMHLGESYVVDELDTEAKVARVHREDVGYYTEPRDHLRVAILHRRGPGVPPAGCGRGVLAFWGPMRASRSVYGYRRKARATGRLIEVADLDAPLPPDETETVGLWLEPPSALRDGGTPTGIGGPPGGIWNLSTDGDPSAGARSSGSGSAPHHGGYARGGLHAVEHLLIGLAPLVVSCDRADLGCQCTRRRGDEHAERLLIFERRPGGAGITQQLLPRLGELLAAAHRRLAACGCGAPGGCPGCIQLPQCGEYNEGLDRRAADRVLRWALGMDGGQ